METYSGTKSEQQAKIQKAGQPVALSARGPWAVGSERAKSKRKRDLQQALPAMQTLLRAKIEPGVVEPCDPTECAKLYTIASVELAQLSGDLGVLDQDRISVIAALFSVDRTLVAHTWTVARLEAEAGYEARRQAARGSLDAGAVAFIAHCKLVDLNEASRAFRKTKARDEALFGRKLIRPPSIDSRTGGWAKTKRIYTGMPTIDLRHDDVVVPAVPDGPGTDRFTTAERKAMAIELGVKTETVRTRERDLSPEAFEAWAERRRKTMATKTKRAAEKAARAGRRRREPAKTAAVRAYILHTGCGERTAWRRLGKLSTADVIAHTPRQTLVLAGGMGCHAMSGFGSDAASERCHANCHGGSDSDSDKAPGNPAFFGNATTNSIENDERVDVGVTAVRATRDRSRRKLGAGRRAMLSVWWRETHGGTLSDATIRQWRHRKVLRDRIEEAERYFVDLDVGPDEQDDQTLVDEHEPERDTAEIATLCDRDRAHRSYAYGRTPSPTPKEQAETMAALISGADRAWADWAAINASDGMVRYVIDEVAFAALHRPDPKWAGSCG